MKFSTLSFAILSTLVLPLATAGAADKEMDASKLPPAADRKDLTYAADIKPIFEKSCVKCHSGEKPKGKLHLDSLEGAIKGGGDGKVIVPGKSGESQLVYSVAH